MYTPEQVREIADKACRYDNSRYQPWSDSNSPHYGDAEHFVRRVLDCLAERASPAVAYRLETDGHITYWPESWQVERERKNLQTLGYPAKVTPLYEHPSPPQAWKVAFDAQREAAMRAHTICYEVMLAHPEIAELGDDGRLHDAIHDILRVDLDPATLKAAQGGVTEAIYRGAVQAWIDRAELDFPARLLAALEAALSAEPAAQGVEWKAPEERYRGVPFAVLGKAFQHVLADPRVVWRDNGGAQTFIDRVQGETATLLASPAPSEGGKVVDRG